MFVNVGQCPANSEHLKLIIRKIEIDFLIL